MTLIIETPYTQARQPYRISLDNSLIMEDVLHVYRIINNQETDVTTLDDQLVQSSDSNYQIMLKFQGPHVSHHGVVFILFAAYRTE